VDRIRNKYNPEDSELKAEKCLDGIQKSEYLGWLEHPCTKALRYTLEASLDRIVLNMVKGVYTEKTPDGTAMQHVRAVGMADMTEEIMSFVETMLENTQRENDPYEEAIYNT
jgi:hypothetical protein